MISHNLVFIFSLKYNVDFGGMVNKTVKFLDISL